MSWATGRHTTREEDEVHLLLGIFSVHMPLRYGEGREKASIRFRRECQHNLTDGHEISNERQQTLLDTLLFDPIDMRRMTIQEAHIHTCRWQLNDPMFLDWLDAAKMFNH